VVNDQVPPYLVRIDVLPDQRAAEAPAWCGCAYECAQMLTFVARLEALQAVLPALGTAAGSLTLPTGKQASNGRHKLVRQRYGDRCHSVKAPAIGDTPSRGDASAPASGERVVCTAPLALGFR
jgi:hypothetical protein